MAIQLGSNILRIMAADESADRDEINQSVWDDFSQSGLLSECEQLINDFLPEGYYCKIDDSAGSLSDSTVPE